MGVDPKAWESYEQVAQYLLNSLAHEFGLGKVEGKQIVPGKSGTTWEIDAKGILLDGVGFVVIECRRYLTSRLTQEDVAAVAYRIQDVGGQGGIIVSPLDVQEGAKKIAEHEGIARVQLDPESTTTDYVLRFLSKVFVGLTATLATTGWLGKVVMKAACNRGEHEECAGDCACPCHRA